MSPSEYARYHKETRRNDKIRPLWEGDRIDIGDRDLEVIMNPGHTRGCLTLPDRKYHSARIVRNEFSRWPG